MKIAKEYISDSYLPEGMTQLELYENHGGYDDMAEDFTEQLLGMLEAKESKQFLLRFDDKNDFVELEYFARAIDKKVTHVLQQAVKLVLQQAKSNEVIQKKIKKLKAEDAKKIAEKDSKPKTKRKKKPTKKKTKVNEMVEKASETMEEVKAKNTETP